MTPKQKEILLNDMLRQVADNENEFPVIDEYGHFKWPILSKSGIRESWCYDENHGAGTYAGLVLEINDHGNVTVWNQFKNGKRREIISRV